MNGFGGRDLALGKKKEKAVACLQFRRKERNWELLAKIEARKLEGGKKEKRRKNTEESMFLHSSKKGRKKGGRYRAILTKRGSTLVPPRREGAKSNPRRQRTHWCCREERDLPPSEHLIGDLRYFALRPLKK